MNGYSVHGVVGAKPSFMTNIYKNFSKSLHSFILLPLLVTNLSGGFDSKINLADLSDKLQSGFGITEQIEEENALSQERKIKAAKIDAYFGQWDLPASGYGMAMVLAAEKYGLDWRLLPALAKLETTGGKHVCKNPSGKNNWFGWNSCKTKFDTVEESFDVIAMNLSGNNPGTARYYAGKTIEQILNVYNPPQTPGITPNYHKKAFNIMSEIENFEIDQSALESNLLVMK